MSHSPNPHPCCDQRVVTPCCSGLALPAQLHAEVENLEDCECADGASLDLFLDTTGTWVGATSGLGTCSNILELLLVCDGTDCSGFRLDINAAPCVNGNELSPNSGCSCQAGQAFSLVFDAVFHSGLGCCSHVDGGGSFRITITE